MSATPRKPDSMTKEEFQAEIKRDERDAAIASGKLVVPLPPGARLMHLGERVERGDLIWKHGWDPCKMVVGDTTIRFKYEVGCFATFRPLEGVSSAEDGIMVTRFAFSSSEK